MLHMESNSTAEACNAVRCWQVRTGSMQARINQETMSTALETVMQTAW